MKAPSRYNTWVIPPSYAVGAVVLGLGFSPPRSPVVPRTHLDDHHTCGDGDLLVHRIGMLALSETQNSNHYVPKT